MGKGGKFESPLGDRLPRGFDNLLAVAAVFPPAEPDEMLGHSLSRGAPLAYHAELVSPGVDEDDLQALTLSVFNNLVERLLAPKISAPDTTVATYRELFAAAYPSIELQDLRIHHVGNAKHALQKLEAKGVKDSWMRETVRVPVKTLNGQKWGQLALLSLSHEVCGETVGRPRELSFAGGHRVRLVKFTKNVHWKIPGGVEVDISAVPAVAPPRRHQR